MQIVMKPNCPNHKPRINRRPRKLLLGPTFLVKSWPKHVLESMSLVDTNLTLVSSSSSKSTNAYVRADSQQSQLWRV